MQNLFAMHISRVSRFVAGDLGRSAEPLLGLNVVPELGVWPK